MSVRRFGAGQPLTAARLNELVRLAVQNIVGGDGIQVSRTGNNVVIGLARRDRGVPPLNSAIAASLTGLKVGMVLFHGALPPKLATGDYGFTVNGHFWKLANGLAVSRTTYSALFSEVGTTFGVGDGSTTFNLPNFVTDGETDECGRVPIGAGKLTDDNPGPLNIGDHKGLRNPDHTITGTVDANTTGITVNMNTTTESVDNTNQLTDVQDGPHDHEITDPGHNHGFTGTGTATADWEHLTPCLAVAALVLCKIG